MNQVKWLRVSLVLLLALGLAIPAVAQVRDPRLSDSQEPGSVIIFPKFVRGTVNGEPRSEFEISLVCPVALRNPDGSCGAFVEGTRFKLKAEWVCPGSQNTIDKFVCREVDFELFTTLNGTVSFNPNNVGAGAFPVPAPGSGTVPTLFTPTVTAQRVFPPPCAMGFVIVWVVDFAGRPMKWDGLIGDAILREANGATAAYNGIPIQAASALENNTLIPGGVLAFDGTAYQAVTGSIMSSVRFDQEATVGPPATPAVTTALILLTLDVLSNAPNYPTFVDLVFYTANEIPFSTATEFICWQEVGLSDLPDTGAGILTVDVMGTRKGLVVSDPARKVPLFGIADTAGPVTLLGIATTVVGTQSYSYSLFNDSIPVPTVFVE